MAMIAAAGGAAGGDGVGHGMFLGGLLRAGAGGVSVTDDNGETLP